MSKPLDKSKILVSLPKTINYIILLVITFVYAVTYDKGFGSALFSVLLILPIVSVIATFVIANLSQLDVNYEVSNTLIEKGDTTFVTIDIKNTGTLPVPFVYVKLKIPEILEVDDNERAFIFSLMPKDNISFKIKVKGKYWGTEKIGIANISILELLGFFQLDFFAFNRDIIEKEKTAQEKYFQTEISVYPALIESNFGSFLTEISISSLFSDSEDEYEFSQSIITTPGYEHREYVEGDSFRMINWKLSSKIDKFMIRELESLGRGKPIIILDPKGIKLFGETGYQLEERIVEGLISSAHALNSSNIKCSLFLKNFTGINEETKSKNSGEIAKFFNEVFSGSNEGDTLIGKKFSRFFADKSAKKAEKEINKIKKPFKNATWEEYPIENEDDVFVLQQSFAKYAFAQNIETERLPLDKLGEEKSTLLIFTCSFDNELRKKIAELTAQGHTVFIVSSAGNLEIDIDYWFLNSDYEFLKIGGDGR